MLLFLQKIESIYIPSTVSKIGKSAFYFCENLQIIEFSEGSMLSSIDSSFFEDCPEFIATIPHKVRILWTWLKWNKNKYYFYIIYNLLFMIRDKAQKISIRS